VYLIDNIQPTISGLLAALVSMSVLELREKEEISSQPNVMQQNEKLLSILCQKNYKKYEIFVQMLKETQQHHVAERMRGS
jgi:Caspase recruitment domain